MLFRLLRDTGALCHGYCDLNLLTVSFLLYSLPFNDILYTRFLRVSFCIPQYIYGGDYLGSIDHMY